MQALLEKSRPGFFRWLSSSVTEKGLKNTTLIVSSSPSLAPTHISNCSKISRNLVCFKLNALDRCRPQGIVGDEAQPPCLQKVDVTPPKSNGTYIWQPGFGERLLSMSHGKWRFHNLNILPTAVSLTLNLWCEGPLVSV